MQFRLIENKFGLLERDRLQIEGHNYVDTLRDDHAALVVDSESVASLFERKPHAGRFSALDIAQKLNYIAEVTAVPYRTMKEFSDRPGTLGLMMGRGLSVSSGSAN